MYILSFSDNMKTVINVKIYGPYNQSRI